MTDKEIQSMILTPLLSKGVKIELKGDDPNQKVISEKIDKIYPAYNDILEDVRNVSIFEEWVQILNDKKLIEIKKENLKIKSIKIPRGKFSICEEYAKSVLDIHLEHINKEEILERCKTLEPLTPCASWYFDSIKKSNCTKKIKELFSLLNLLRKIESNREDIFLREFSMIVSEKHDSKSLEKSSLLKEACNILKEYYHFPKDNDYRTVLNYFHILMDDRVLIKGDFVLHFYNGNIIKVNDLSLGIQLSDEDIQRIKMIKINADEFYTIENLTSYKRFNSNYGVGFYTGGFCSKSKIGFLKKIYSKNQQVKYYHFGDIDYGGIQIYQNLIKETKIPFTPFCMDVEQLSKEENQKCLQELTENDIRGLKNLKEDLDCSEFDETIDWMLNNHKKLEQEIVSYRLFC